METCVLFSYPRSGNTWVRYLVEVLTGRPTLGTPDNPNDVPIHARHADLPVDPEAAPSALKRHRLEQLEPGDEHRRLVVLVRNYKEAILRVRDHWEAKEIFDLGRERRRYFEPIRYFDDHKADKRLFHYEDLVTRPAETVRALADFIGAPPDRRDAVLGSYDAHRARSLENYDAVSGSHTFGEKTVFHALKLRPDERVCWDEEMCALEADLFRRYLSRYAETEVPA